MSFSTTYLETDTLFIDDDNLLKWVSFQEVVDETGVVFAHLP